MGSCTSSNNSNGKNGVDKKKRDLDKKKNNQVTNNYNIFKAGYGGADVAGYNAGGIDFNNDIHHHDHHHDNGDDNNNNHDGAHHHHDGGNDNHGGGHHHHDGGGHDNHSKLLKSN